MTVAEDTGRRPRHGGIRQRVLSGMMHASLLLRRPATRSRANASVAAVSLALCGAMVGPSLAAAQPATLPPPAAQNPSPMTESTRAHERLTERAPEGVAKSVPGPAGRPVDLLIPETTRSENGFELVLHFHGAAWLAHQSVATSGNRAVSAVINLGAGSGAYHRAFSDAAVFDSLLAQIAREVSAVRGRPVRMTDVTLSGFSAGHGAIRQILREPRHVERVQRVLLLDGLHTSYVPEGRPLAAEGTLDTMNLVAIREFARAAMRGEKSLVISHSEIFPGTFASTTETADWLLGALGLRRTPVLKWGPRGMQQLSDVHSGAFVVLGFAGNTAPDHIDHLHAMPELLARVLSR